MKSNNHSITEHNTCCTGNMLQSRERYVNNDDPGQHENKNLWKIWILT